MNYESSVGAAQSFGVATAKERSPVDGALKEIDSQLEAILFRVEALEGRITTVLRTVPAAASGQVLKPQAIPESPMHDTLTNYGNRAAAIESRLAELIARITL